MKACVLTTQQTYYILLQQTSLIIITYYNVSAYLVSYNTQFYSFLAQWSVSVHARFTYIHKMDFKIIITYFILLYILFSFIWPWQLNSILYMVKRFLVDNNNNKKFNENAKSHEMSRDAKNQSETRLRVNVQKTWRRCRRALLPE